MMRLRVKGLCFKNSGAAPFFAVLHAILKARRGCCLRRVKLSDVDVVGGEMSPHTMERM